MKRHCCRLQSLRVPGRTLRRRLATLVLAACGCLSLATACGRRPSAPATASDKRPSAPASDLRVATWNLRWFPSGRPEAVAPAAERRAVETAAREVRRAEPHILCVQEVRDRAAAEDLARTSDLKGLRVVACTTFPPVPDAKGTQQIAILSNLPVRESGEERWRTVGLVDPPRGYAFAVFETPSGPVAVFSVHLKSNYVGEGQNAAHQAKLNRLKRELAGEQLRAAVRRLRTRAKDPVSRVVVAGDFNTSLDDPRWEGESTVRGFLEEGYRSCFEGMPREQTRTLAANAYHPATTFDHVLQQGFTGPQDTRVHAKSWVSDHRMVSVRLTGAVSDIAP